MDKKIGFIGAGNMGMALIKGLIDSEDFDVDRNNIFVFDVDVSKKDSIEELSLNFVESVKDVFNECDYIFLMIKPQQLNGLLDEVGPLLGDNTVLVSVCAGISIDFIRKKLNKNAKIVLAMPNTPILFGRGATAVATDEFTGNDELEYVRTVFESCGVSEIVPLDKMADIIAINGSSPAFIYLFAQGFMEYAEEQGIEFYAAQKLFAHSLIGAAKMITSSEMSIHELIAQVSSKGGTTIAGLEKLFEGELITVVKNACTACAKRAREIEKEIE